MSAANLAVPWTLYVVVFLDLFQLTIFNPILPRILEKDEAEFMHTVSIAAEAVGTLLLSYIADVVGRKPALIVSAIGSTLQACILCFSEGYRSVLLATFFAGISRGTRGAATAFVADCTSFQERPKYLSQVTAAHGLGSFLGPVIGRCCFRTFGGMGTKFSCPLALAVSLCNIGFICRALPDSVQDESALLTKNVIAAWLSLPKSIWIACGAICLSGPVAMTFSTFGSKYITDQIFYGYEQDLFSLIGTLVCILSVIFILPFFLYEHVLKATGITGSIILGGLLSASGFSGSMLTNDKHIFFYCSLLWVMGIILTSPAVSFLITRIASPGMFATALGWMIFFEKVGMLFGATVTKLVADGPIAGNAIFVVPLVVCLLATFILAPLAAILGRQAARFSGSNNANKRRPSISSDNGNADNEGLPGLELRRSLESSDAVGGTELPQRSQSFTIPPGA